MMVGRWREAKKNTLLRMSGVAESGGGSVVANEQEVGTAVKGAGEGEEGGRLDGCVQ